MTTPRIEEMVSRKVAITKYLRNTYGLDDDDTLNAGEVEELCEMIVEHFASQAHQAGIEDAVEIVENYFKGLIFVPNPQSTKDNLIKTLQDKK